MVFNQKKQVKSTDFTCKMVYPLGLEPKLDGVGVVAQGNKFFYFEYFYKYYGYFE